MTDQRLNEKLVEDIVRVFTVLDRWDRTDCEFASCQERERFIADRLNAGGEQELSCIVQRILDRNPDPIIGDIFDRSYIESINRLLLYRIDASPAEKQKNPVYCPDENYDLEPYLAPIRKSLVLCNSSIIGSRAAEIVGDLTALSCIISGDIGTDVELVQTDIFGAHKVHSDKVHYLGHDVWVVSQILPPILVKRVKEPAFSIK